MSAVSVILAVNKHFPDKVQMLTQAKMTLFKSRVMSAQMTREIEQAYADAPQELSRGKKPWVLSGTFV